MNRPTDATAAPPAAPAPVRRSDYRPPAFLCDRVDLRFELGDPETIVRARLALRRNAAVNDGSEPLVLDGEELDLRELRINGRRVESGEYTYEDRRFTMPLVPEDFEFETAVAIRPGENTQLSGLYRSNGIFCTQCEAEGFRRITLFPDRPDVMARYRVEIVAERELAPVMLSNGNLIEEGTLPDGRAFARWEDPFPKPSYLFALVAGDLVAHRGEFRTCSGRDIPCEIWVEPRNADKCEHALQALFASMRWDEEKFGLELDLDRYMVVAVDDFNMGAMENKGLNVFNSKYVLARPETATDGDYEAIEGVIAHEYFHNWTGNRVTCRDWFQLTLKEGLTVFRDRMFSADRTSQPVQRIADVAALRSRQFVEDEGPMAHPVRPESYVCMDNFYTATVYEKGAEVVGMYRTLLGEGGFRRGMDLYFERHDGQAVTCDDFRAAMADASQADLIQFERWYARAGTPTLTASGTHDATNGTYALTLRQGPPRRGPAAGGDWEPLHVPVAVGLVGSDGADVPLALAGEPAEDAPTTRVLNLVENEATYVFAGVDSMPVPSVLRNFSAPVRLELERTRDELTFLMAHDSDPFNRWDAGQTLATQLLLELADTIATGGTPALEPSFVAAAGRILADEALDGSMKALALALPGERVLAQEQDTVDPDALFAAREAARRSLATALAGDFEQAFLASAPSGPYRFENAEVDRRRLRNTSLAYLCLTGEERWIDVAADTARAADNMTDRRAALSILCDLEHGARDEALASFRAEWEHDPLVLDTWFALQACARREQVVDDVLALANDAAFVQTNPNRVRSLVTTFCVVNQRGFHALDGRGYRFLGEQIAAVDGRNPQLASGLAKQLQSWRRFDTVRQELQRDVLERLRAGGPSPDLGEVVARALENGASSS